jgi:hypothetical protein
MGKKSMRAIRMLAAFICLMTGGGIVPAIAGDEPSALRYQTYVDVGYAASNRDASDDNWTGKSSTATLNELTLNLAMANIGRDATRDARWGFELGLQAYTGTVKYQFLPRNNRLVLTLELRHDKTSGSEGGFPDEPNDEFKDDQALLLAGFLWTFAR